MNLMLNRVNGCIKEKYGVKRVHDLTAHKTWKNFRHNSNYEVSRIAS